eukprot:jgi/Psemu1/287198/fgenesh1_pg.179_\
MEPHQEAYQGPLPDTFKRGLDALEVNYPGCERDLVTARECLEYGPKAKFLKAFRILKGKQIAHEHFQEASRSNNLNIFELNYPGNGADIQELQNWFNENPPSEKNVKIFQERLVGLRNKNTVFQGDRSHPNIVALLKLQLSYPGCEKDVQEALQVHYTLPVTMFPDAIHSLRVKQDLYRKDRSHWRLVKLDDLELTYPKWREDFIEVEDWHIHNEDNRENAATFREMIEGMLEQEELYLGWSHERMSVKANEELSLEYSTSGTHNDFRDVDVQEHYDVTTEERYGGSSVDKNMYMKEKKNHISHFDSRRTVSISELYEEGRDVETEYGHYD